MNRDLTARQLELLRRMVDDGHQPSSEEATSVYALRSRGLVTTRSPRAYHTAVPTPLGRTVAVDGVVQRATGKGATSAPAPAAVGPAAVNVGEHVPGVPSTVEMFVAELGTAGGRLTIESPSAQLRAAWRRLISTSHGHPAVPAGLRVRHSGRDSGDLAVWLEMVLPDIGESPPIVPIPDQVRSPHPMIAALRETRAGKDGWIVTKHREDVVHVRIHKVSHVRAVRLLHAVVQEATRRGYAISKSTSHHCKGGLWIDIRGHLFEITMHEETRRVEHVPTPAEQRRIADGWSFRVPAWDYEPSGRLVLRNGHDSYGGRELANDRQRWQIEDRLGHAFERLESLAADAEARHQEHLKRELAAREQWEAAMERARERYEEQYRIDHLMALVERHEQAKRIRDFVADAANVATTDEMRAWLAQANAIADALDPITAGFDLPIAPKPRPDDLKPFLGALSPYGPDRVWWGFDMPSA